MEGDCRLTGCFWNATGSTSPFPSARSTCRAPGRRCWPASLCRPPFTSTTTNPTGLMTKVTTRSKRPRGQGTRLPRQSPADPRWPLWQGSASSRRLPQRRALLFSQVKELLSQKHLPPPDATATTVPGHRLCWVSRDLGHQDVEERAASGQLSAPGSTQPFSFSLLARFLSVPRAFYIFTKRC